MTWESDFTSQWQTFLDIVETNVSREIKSNNHLTSEFVNNIIQKEIEKWSLSNHYNGSWLRNLEYDFPSLGQEFRSTLEQVNLTSRISFKKRSLFLSSSGIIGIFLILVIFLVLNQVDELITKFSLSLDFSLSLRQQILSTVLASIIIFPIVKNIQEQKNEKAINQLIERIKRDLEFHGEKLKDIAIRVDLESSK